MLIVSEKQHEMLCTITAEADSMIEKEDLDNLLDSIDDAILENFTPDFQVLTAKGVELQQLYDDIYYANKKRT